MKNKITIAIPAFNNEKHIGEAIESALAQEYPLKQILIIDDCSTDNTYGVICDKYEDMETLPSVLLKVRFYRNEENLGIGKNLEKLMTECQTKYIIYLCADDVFANKKVLTDVVNQFDNGDPSVGVIGRYYYYFMDGHEGAIGVCRERNILIQSCCPSGMAFRRMDIIGTKKIFVEMPSIVLQYLKKYRWTMLEYDTVAARYHPGGNTGTKTSYYTESPTQNWIDLIGENYQDFPMFIQLKNRAPHLLIGEICLHVRNDKRVFLKYQFWLNALTALLIPGFLLRKVTKWYRSCQTAQIIERPNNV